MSQQAGPHRKPILDLRHPFLRPMWRRVVMVAFLAVWTGIEILGGNPYWAMLAGGIGVYAIWVFFFSFEAPDAVADDTKPDT